MHNQLKIMQNQKIQATDYKFLSPKYPVFVFGAGGFGQKVADVLRSSGYKFAGYVTSDTWFNNLHNQQVQIVIGIFNRDVPLNKVYNEAIKKGFKNIFMPWDFYNQFHYEMGWRYWLARDTVVAKNLGSINQVVDLFADVTSVECFYNIINFRSGHLLEYSSFTHNLPQYFNDLTLNKPINMYVDGGAYIGDTYNYLIERIDVARSYLIEPDPNNFARLTSTVKQAVCLPMALSDKIELVKFASDSSESAHIDARGTYNIMTVSLDQLFPNVHNLSFIKLDLEGGEFKAIKGAERLIRNSRPVIAVSIYHKPEDIWEIPLLLSEYCEDYNFYLRQHNFNSFDSVLYAVPK